MDKEIIQLLQGLASNAETLVVWYMVLGFVEHCVSWAGAVGCCYAFGVGVRRGWNAAMSA